MPPGRPCDVLTTEAIRGLYPTSRGFGVGEINGVPAVVPRAVVRTG